jgi:hypothetical protein
MSRHVIGRPMIYDAVMGSRTFRLPEEQLDWLERNANARGISQSKLVRRLVQAGEEMEPGRWWRVLGPDDALWCETSEESEAREAMRPGDRLQRIYQVTYREWRDES